MFLSYEAKLLGFLIPLAGDLTKRVPLEKEGIPVKGEHYRMGAVCNAMVDQLNTITYEVTRVAREVGMDGQLGGHANVEGACGSWKDLTDKVIIS